MRRYRHSVLNTMPRLACGLVILLLSVSVSAGEPIMPVDESALPATGSRPRSPAPTPVVESADRVLSSDFNVGDVFVGVASGTYYRYDNAGVFIESLTSSYGGYTTGCAFDTAGNLFTTHFTSNRVVAFARATPHNVVLDISTAGVTSPNDDANESIVFDAVGNFLVGHAAGGDDVHRYTAAGVLTDEFDVVSGIVGSDWVDLAADGCTLYYTAEGRTIYRYDICSSTQLADFATLPGTGSAFALRLLSSCDGSDIIFTGLLVADGSTIKRLDSTGAVDATYDVAGQDSWFALNLDPNGTSFWSADFVTSNFYRFNILTGGVEIGPINTGTATFSAFGLCVLGEVTSATEQCTNGIDDNCNGLIDCNDPICAAAPECAGCVDTAGPDITCSAVTPFTSPQNRAWEPETWDEPRTVRREQMIETVLNGEIVDRAAAADIAAKLGLGPEQVIIYDGRAPELRSSAQRAVSCSSPCTSGVLDIGNPTPDDFYDVALSCSTGAFTARTSTDHPDGANHNVIYGGSFLSPGTSDVTFRVHNNNGVSYLNPTGGEACAFDPPDTAFEPNNVGIEAEWTRTPLPGLNLTLREEIVAFGSTADNSGVRLTLCAANDDASTVTADMGVRWQIDYQNAGDDGPLFAGVTCDPFEVGAERSTEHEFADAEILDFYRIQNNTSAPIFGNFNSTTSLAGFPGTGTPDRLIYGRWGSMSGSVWNYVANEGANADSDSAVLYYYGYTPADAIRIAPGESFCRSVVLFTKGDDQDCGDFTPGTGADQTVVVCPDDDATVGATATDDCTANPSVTLVNATPGAPTCTGNPCSMNFPTSGTYQYTWEAEDDVGNTTICVSEVVVLSPSDPSCNQPPTCDAGGPYSTDCTSATIDGATATDPNDETVDYTWDSDNPDVTLTPSAGSVLATSTGSSVPSSTATLDGDACGATATLTLTVTDAAGTNSTCDTTVTFNDNVAPTITCPGPLSVQCSEDVPAADTSLVTASDNCSDVEVTHVGDVSDGLSCAETITRTYRVADACGNANTCEQIITVDDVTDPVVDPLDPVSVECIEDVPAADTAIVTFSDNCAAPTTVTHVADASDGQTCPETITRTYRVTDGCGNSTDVEQTITVDDVTDPVVDPLDPVSVECIEDVPAADTAIVTFSDNCAAPSTVTHVGDASDGQTCPETITRTYRVTDGCGNSTDVEQTITVDDVTDPVVDPLDPVSVECIEDVPAADTAIVIFSDNCAAPSSVAHVGDVSDGLSCPETIVRTYRVIDGCGNATDVQQIIVVNDTTDPTASALLQPLPATPPASPASANSVCSAPSSRQFVVVCGGEDNCDPEVDLSAVLVVTNTDVSSTGECLPVVEEVAVACGDLIELQLAAPPCPATSPQSAHPASEVNSAGITVVTGERIVLRVTATDDCGNTGDAMYDPAAEPSPLCDEVLIDGTCCPAIGQPSGGPCNVPRCETGGGFTATSEPTSRRNQ